MIEVTMFYSLVNIMLCFSVYGEWLMCCLQPAAYVPAPAPAANAWKKGKPDVSGGHHTQPNHAGTESPLYSLHGMLLT